ncbi:hypothetical protein [Streptomyces canus]
MWCGRERDERGSCHEIRAEAAGRGLSAYVAGALRFKRDRDRLLELVD